MKFPVKALHSSGRFDRDTTAATAADYTLELAQWIRETGATILTVTECGDADRWSAVMALPGWTGYRCPNGHGANECGIAWLDDDYEQVDAAAPALTDKTYFHDGTGRPTDPVHACTVVLRSRKNAARIIQSVVHTPSHVEAAKGWRIIPRRIAAYRGAMKGWRAHLHDMVHAHPRAAVRVTADWNVNLKRLWVRAYIKSSWRGYTVVANLAGPGTHAGGRLIDFSLIRSSRRNDGTGIQRAGKSQVLTRHNKDGHHIEWQSTDHDPVADDLALIVATSKATDTHTDPGTKEPR